MQPLDIDPLGGVIVASGDDLDDFVAGEFELRDVGCAAGHKVAVKDSEDGFVGDDQEVVLFAFEFKDYRF